MELFYIFYTPFPEMLMCIYIRNTYVKTLGTVTKENPFNNLALGNKTDDIVNHFHLSKVYEWKFQVHIMSGSCSNERQWFFLVKLGQLIVWYKILHHISNFRMPQYFRKKLSGKSHIFYFLLAELLAVYHHWFIKK